MKKTGWLFLLFHLVSATSFGQESLSQAEKIANYIRSHTEADCRKLLDGNGFTALNFMKGCPECLNGYTFYADSRNIGGETVTYPLAKHCYIEKGKMISLLSEKMGGEIAFTLTAKNRLSADCIVFITTTGFAYIYNIFKFDKVVPVSLELCGISFMDNTIKSGFSFGTLDNSDQEKNDSYNFAALASNWNCRVISKNIINPYLFGDKNSFTLPVAFTDQVADVRQKYGEPTAKLENPSKDFFARGENSFMVTYNTDGKVEKIEFYVTYGDNNTFVMYNKPIYGILLLSYMDDIIKAHGEPKERNIPDKIFLPGEAVWLIGGHRIAVEYRREDMTLGEGDNQVILKVNTISRITVSQSI